MTTIQASEVLDRFRAALVARDIVPPDPIIADRRLHRCDAAGGMENWRDGLGWQPWRLDIGRTLSAAA